MTKSTSKAQTRYAVVSKATGKTLKNASTRDEARTWKRFSGKNGLGIFDRQSNEMTS